MSELRFILGLPKQVEVAGYIHPIKIKDYDLFSEHSFILQVNKNVFTEQLHEIPLLDLLVFGLEEMKEEINPIRSLETVFSLVLREKVTYISDEFSHAFISESGSVINSQNYDEVREVIMENEIIFEPKVFKNKMVQEWANKVMKAKAKNNKITLEEQISVVQIYTGNSYEEIGEYTIYQLYASFNRIAKLISYETTVNFKVAGADIQLEDYSEKINLHKNPYDSLFVENEKLGDINKALT